MRLLGGAGGADCFPILTKEVFDVATDSGTINYLEKADLDKVVIQCAVFSDVGRSIVFSVFLNDLDQNGRINVFNDGDVVLEIKNITSSSFNYDLDPYGYGKYNGGTMQLTIIDIDATVDKTTITQASNAGEVLHVVDIIEWEKALVSFNHRSSTSGRSFGVYPIEENEVLVDGAYGSDAYSWGAKVTLNSLTELSLNTLGSDDTYTHNVYIRQFS